MNKVPTHPPYQLKLVQQFSKSAYSLDLLNMHPLGVSVPFTQLIGREHEVEVICDLLKRSEVRLLTLTGPGGVGKTRLAQQVLANVPQVIADGYGFVALAPINDPHQVLLEIHRAFRLRRIESVSFLKQLQDFLKEKQFMLVLDNFEQVVTAAPLLLELLSSCVGLKLLVTSRSILGVQGEYEFVVPPLALPDMKDLPDNETLSRVPAVALFVQRARTVKHDFQVNDVNACVIASICTRLDGLPLAIELAAARIKLLSPTALLVRLERRLQVLTGGGVDLPERQQTIYNTIKWSYDLLNHEEQLLFRRMSVFMGGCTLEAIEWLDNVLGGISISVLERVTSLLNKSLLRLSKQEGEEPRMVMLETVREFSLEALTACGELERTIDAYVAYYYELAQGAEPVVFGMSQGPWFRQLEQESANVRAALDWLLRQKEVGERLEVTLWLAVAMGLLCLQRGDLSEGRSFLERALAANRESAVPVSNKLKAEVLYVAGRLGFWQRDFEPAAALLEEGLALFRMLGETRGIAASLNLLGIITIYRMNFERGESMLAEGLRLSQETSDQAGVAHNLRTQGILAFYRGEYARAQACCQESLELCTVLGDIWSTAVNLHYLGWVATVHGEYTSALSLSEESVVCFKTLGNPMYLIEALIVLAFEHAMLGDENKSSSLLEEALDLSRAQESWEDISRTFWGMGHIALRQNKPAQAREMFKQSIQTLREGVIFPRLSCMIASSLEGLGEIALAEGKSAWAVMLFAAAMTQRTMKNHIYRHGIEQPFYDRTLVHARRGLGEKTFAMLWAGGQRMTPEQALTAEETRLVTNDANSGAIKLPANQQSLTYPYLETLTARELEVLRLVAAGLKNKQIAERLVISPSTVDTHIQSIYNRLGISSRSAATRFAIEHHFL